MAAKPRFILHLRTRGLLIRHGVYPSFREAATLGQSLSGYAGFHVDSGDYVPSRSEQLLEERAEPLRRRAKHLALTEQD